MDRTLATGFTTGRHTLYLFCSILFQRLSVKKIEQDKNKNLSIRNIKAMRPTERGLTSSIKKRETESNPRQPEAWLEPSTANLPRSPIKRPRMLKPWTTQADFLISE
jgi:hypothetical protein